MNTATPTLEETTQQLVEIIEAYMSLGIAMAIIPYVLFAVGLYGVATRYGLRNKWMAWLPVARKHLLAEIADLRRFQAKKQKKMVTQFEIITCICLICIYAAIKLHGPLFLMLTGIVIMLLKINQVFCYYYFYRICDPENSVAYFILGLLFSPLNAIFVFHCRRK
jgi:hypothetical protein